MYQYVSKACEDKFEDYLKDIDYNVSKHHLIKQNETNLNLVKFRILLSKAYS